MVRSIVSGATHPSVMALLDEDEEGGLIFDDCSHIAGSGH